MYVTNIHITAVDNELYILAAQNPTTTSEICHLKSGYNKPVDYSVIPQSILPHGNYTLIMIGINWGGPQAFKVTLTDSNNVNTDYVALPNTTIGANWTVAIPITV